MIGALCLVLLAAAPQGKPDARLSGLVAALGDAANPQARANAYNTLWREHPAAAIPLLVEALPRYDLLGQQYGLWILQSYPPEEGRAALHKLALERSALLETGAAAKLFQLGEREMLEHVLRAFGRKDTTPEVRRAMLQLVLNLDEPRLSAAVRSWVAPESDALLLESALYHLYSVKDPEARARAQALLGSAGLAQAQQLVCAGFLLALGDDAQGQRLGELLASDDGTLFVRLQRFLAVAPRVPEELADALAGVAERASAPLLAQSALAVLAQHAGPKQLPRIEKLLDSPNPLVAKAALEALQRRGVSLPHDSLQRMLESKEPLRALSAADALRRVDDLSGFPRVLEIAHAGGTDAAEAVRVLAKFRRRESVPALLDALADADTAVRFAAEQGLVTLLPDLFPYRRFDLGSSGYASSAPPEQRAAGLAKLRAWWTAASPKR